MNDKLTDLKNTYKEDINVKDQFLMISVTDLCNYARDLEVVRNILDYLSRGYKPENSYQETYEDMVETLETVTFNLYDIAEYITDCIQHPEETITSEELIDAVSIAFEYTYAEKYLESLDETTAKLLNEYLDTLESEVD